MKARLILLIVVAGGLAVWVARPRSIASTAPAAAVADVDPLEQARIDQMKIMLSDRNLPGQEPPEAPEVNVGVEVDVCSRRTYRA